LQNRSFKQHAVKLIGTLNCATCPFITDIFVAFLENAAVGLLRQAGVVSKDSPFAERKARTKISELVMYIALNRALQIDQNR